jgi:hypothetical protein
MCALTMPGMTYLPAASITASADEGATRERRSPDGVIVEMRPSSTRTSIGPYAGFALP